MDSGIWALGLLLIPIIGYAIVIFLIIKLIKFIKNKTKKRESNNITTNYNTKKENSIKIDGLENDITINNKKTNLYKIFIVSILICIFLLPFVNSMTSKFPDAYPGSEAESGVITSEIANQIAIYVWPILIVYSIMLIILVIKKTNYRKVYYPLSLFTLTVIIFNLGIIYSGYMMLWYLLILFYPLIALIVVLSIIGNKLDNNTISKKTVGIILGSILLIMSIIPILTLVSFTKNKDNEPIYNYEKKEEKQNNKYEIAKNITKQEFNDLLDNNFISVNELKLSENYSTLDRIELLITTDNVPNNEIDFCNKLIDSYNDIKGLLNKYNYTSQTIHFKFTNNNPFAKEGSTNYRNSGYIRVGGYIDSDRTWYHIYLNPTPIEIN